MLALFGLRQGFIVGVLSFGGFVLGAFLGTRLGPLLLPQGSASPYAPAFGLVGALLAGAILATGLEGLGLRLRRVTACCPASACSTGVVGGALRAPSPSGSCGSSAAVVAQAPGASALRADIQRSAILRELNGLLPPSGPILDALARLDPLPAIPGPCPRSPAPAEHRAATRAWSRRALASCACSAPRAAWRSRAPGGSRGPKRCSPTPTSSRARATRRSRSKATPPACPRSAIAFDPTDDLAVLRVPGLHCRR